MFLFSFTYSSFIPNNFVSISSVFSKFFWKFSSTFPKSFFDNVLSLFLFACRMKISVPFIKQDFTEIRKKDFNKNVLNKWMIILLKLCHFQS